MATGGGFGVDEVWKVLKDGLEGRLSLIVDRTHRNSVEPLVSRICSNYSPLRSVPLSQTAPVPFRMLADLFRQESSL